jgi:CubicO group peptidase (beta-lactamase class C family)
LALIHDTSASDSYIVPFSAGGLVSTFDDLLRWNIALHTDGLLNGSSHQRMIAEYPETQKGNEFYGYGLFIGKTSGYACLSHSGGVSGFIAVLQYYPELQGSLIVLSNVLNPSLCSRSSTGSQGFCSRPDPKEKPDPRDIIPQWLILPG